MRLGPKYNVEKVDDIVKIMEFGVMMTPALAVDGVVKAAGKVLTPEEIIAFCQEKMARFMVPKDVIIIDQLPMNPHGKIIKSKLREKLELEDF